MILCICHQQHGFVNAVIMEVNADNGPPLIYIYIHRTDNANKNLFCMRLSV